MNSHQTNILVHLDEPLETKELVALQGALGHIGGVIQVSPSVRPQMVWVDYDSGATAAKTIIEQVRRQGLGARLIGL